MVAQEISFSSLDKKRESLVNFSYMKEVYSLYPPAQMNTSCYTRYVGASRVISKTIRDRDKFSLVLVGQIESCLEKLIEKEKRKFTNNELQFLVELKNQLNPPEQDEDENDDDEDEESETSLVVEISDKKKFTNLVERYFSGSILNEILGFYEDYNFDITTLFTSPEYIGYMNEAIEAAFNLPKGITANWGLEQLREMQKVITKAINNHAKSERKAEKLKKKSKNPLNDIKNAESKTVGDVKTVFAEAKKGL